ncbi:MAG: class I SAM-dependent methyltransferase [Planctomycetales bacterium]|nr:class I SAM-dependent methyltransferase [Planctomycetales bacterium]
MSLLADLRVLYHMVLKPVRGTSHAERLESFYSGQAGDYDEFRKRLLKGREEMYRSLQLPDDAVWVDMGGGTGSNLEYLSDQIPRLKKIYVVDLSSSLLKVADARIQSRGWTNVETCEADATKFTPPDGKADVVTFSYSLTMIPDWFSAIENAHRILADDGQIGVADFFVSRKYPSDGIEKHGWFTRNFWPVWFSSDNVFPSGDHLPFLNRHFVKQQQSQHRAKVPYIPLIRVPYYNFIGRKSDAA